MLKPNYQFEKRQRENEKKKKKAEKAERKAQGLDTVPDDEQPESTGEAQPPTSTPEPTQK